MRTRKRTRITIETAEVMVIRKHPLRSTPWCDQCREQVSMVTPDEAFALSGISQRLIYRRVEAEEVHTAETASGALLICLNSLPEWRASISQKEILDT